jgi:two-component system, OmpR family, phosphate regulon sensor histidine kinase PhoR
VPGDRSKREGASASSSRPGAPSREHALAWPPFRIALTYAVVAVVWIACSDVVLGVIAPGAKGVVLSIGKGTAFVVVTALLLYALVSRRERALRAIADEVRSTIESIGDGILLVDAGRRVVDANRAAVQLLGVESREALFGPVVSFASRFALRSADGAPIAPDQLASYRALAGAQVVPYDGIARRADGRDVFVSISAAPVAGPDGRPRAAVTILRDVSAARRLDELRDEFLSTAAHEFKTPLAVVKAYAQLLQKRDPSEADALVVIQRQVDRLNRLVQHLLDTTRLRLDDGVHRRERFDLGELASAVVERMRPSSPAHPIGLSAAPAPVLAERERIARAMTSLLDNAVRFSPGGGPVEARVEVREREAVFSVEDHGLGIAPERQARIFERYYRAHAGTPLDYGGLGLGLDMSREIVQRHGGRMWFESEQGRGSTFHFSLPLAGEAP